MFPPPEDTEEAEAVRLAFELFAYGETQPDGAISDVGRPSIAKRLDAMGIRNRKGLPVRGQRTKTNARTRKGPAKTIANKKK